MNCLTPHDAVNNVLDALHKPLLEQIDQTIDFYGNDAETFLKPLTTDIWMKQEPYRAMTFEFEWARFNFLQLCNMVELMFGTTVESEFVRELTTQIREHVEARLKFKTEVEESIKALEFKYRREKEIEQEAIA